VYKEHHKKHNLGKDVTTNIIYMTTACNLSCTYCYQHLDTAKKKHITREELVKAADSTLAREDKDTQTFFILYGGEVTLRWEDVKFFMDYVCSKKDNVQFNMISNGIRFLDNDFTKDFINNIHYKNGKVQLDISFDGMTGNKERIYHNGDESANDMLEILSKLKLISIQYRLRYTINKLNITHFVEDVLKLIEHFKPSRLVLGEVLEIFDEDDLILLKQGKKELLDLWHKQELTVPVCTRFDEFCKYCNGCEIQRDGLSLYSPEEKETFRDYTSIGLFEDFKQKEK